MVEELSSSKKKTAGQYTHWARPKWIRMYNYNYEFGESYYRPQVKYMSTSKALSSYDSSSSYGSNRNSSSAFFTSSSKRRASPPKAMSFIERWTAEPFYGNGFQKRGSSLNREEHNWESSMFNRAESIQRESQIRSASRALSMEREASVYRRGDTVERDVREVPKSARAPSEYRSRREGSSEIRSRFENSSNYASPSLLEQINNVRATSAALQEESNVVQERLHHRRARSMEALRKAEEEAFYRASDDCRSNALDFDTARRSRREQSVLSDIESRYQREGSLTRSTLRVDEDNMLRGKSLDNSYNYEYPTHHLVCTEKCPLFTDPEQHRRFVIGNRFLDAAALGGFDVLYDPSVNRRAKGLLQRLSEERDVEELLMSRESSVNRASQSRYAYNTIY